MDEAKKLESPKTENPSGPSLHELGPGTDLEAYGARRTRQTKTESRFTSHLESLLQEGINKSEEGAVHKNFHYTQTILSAVVYERYDTALKELNMLLESRQDYPDFGSRAGAYVQYAKSLVKAIRAKRMVGKLPYVSRSKQKELVNILSSHFQELRSCFLNIEKVESYIRYQELSSTRWFMLSCFWALAAVFLYGMSLVIFPDVFMALHHWFTHYLHWGFGWLAQSLWGL